MIHGFQTKIKICISLCDGKNNFAKTPTTPIMEGKEELTKISPN
jgi:hypothetical protein